MSSYLMSTITVSTPLFICAAKSAASYTLYITLLLIPGPAFTI